MELQDHFRPPLSSRRHWHAFYNAWATYISSDLNEKLPESYFAEPNVQFGIEIDVAAFEEAGGGKLGIPRGAATVWTAPEPTQSVALSLLTDMVEVLVFSQEAGPVLAGAIELVSPSNKDRQAQRDAFINKCAAYVQQGVGLVIVDVVTDRKPNLHTDLLARLGATVAVPLEAELYASSYRPTVYSGEDRLDIWQEPLAVGSPLPVLPFWLLGGVCVPLDLAATYDRTCREQRIAAGA